ncbi:hypothetical protein WME90_41995 [Sorangium sp. So ce375]|uniref:hypothetical protein n=1 Tax=Sorangium sp. So ce375 TaxID=3133306 RepID=UPI003F5CA1D0
MRTTPSSAFSAEPIARVVRAATLCTRPIAATVVVTACTTLATYCALITPFAARASRWAAIVAAP